MTDQADIASLARAARARVPVDAAQMLLRETPERIALVLAELPPKLARRIVEELPPDLRPSDPMSATTELQIPGTVMELMESANGVLPAVTSVEDAIAFLRGHDTPHLITYLYITGDDGRLVGMVVIRDLLLAVPGQTLADIMLPDPFCLQQDQPASEAIKLAVHRHYPVYPVTDGDGHIVGVVRGWRLFERQAIEITAQSGQMVGVDKEERVHTPLMRSFIMRHPWLQVNLITAFGTAFVVGSFDATIEKLVVLAAFLPVLSCLAGNNGCQALAITIRGLTLGDLQKYPIGRLLRKELLIGALNGFCTGLVGAVAMYAFALYTHQEHPVLLALVMLASMTGACVISCLLGTLVPLVLKRAGADPATASSIFVLTATDILGMGLMLTLATLFVL